MARNELTRSARVISDRVFEKYYRQKQVDIADAMNTTPSTVSRFVSSHESVNTFNFIVANDFDIFDKDTQVAIDKKEFELLLLAADGFSERLREKYLGKKSHS